MLSYYQRSGLFLLTAGWLLLRCGSGSAVNTTHASQPAAPNQEVATQAALENTSRIEVEAAPEKEPAQQDEAEQIAEALCSKIAAYLDATYLALERRLGVLATIEQGEAPCREQPLCLPKTEILDVYSVKTETELKDQFLFEALAKALDVRSATPLLASDTELVKPLYRILRKKYLGMSAQRAVLKATLAKGLPTDDNFSHWLWGLSELMIYLQRIRDLSTLVVAEGLHPFLAYERGGALKDFTSIFVDILAGKTASPYPQTPFHWENFEQRALHKDWIPGWLTKEASALGSGFVTAYEKRIAMLEEEVEIYTCFKQLFSAMANNAAIAQQFGISLQSPQPSLEHTPATPSLVPLKSYA